ncbi:hypothetical protein KP509_14G087300 [Ceratopteris richardii]|uniref:TATA-box-binding protein n=1 Tax=Ceratopteris richardii TaxID=49495 RepID=A0A8T2TF31_CERRI|nr:hypothetical protein KP509_14G087300 [Ceratopteris richardii]
MELQPLNVKQRTKLIRSYTDDEDEVPIRQTGPIISSPTSVEIWDKDPFRRVSQFENWWCIPPRAPVYIHVWNLAPAGIRPVIQNVVCSVDMDCTLRLEEVVKKLRNSTFNPARFSACVVQLREPRTTALIFRTGKAVITGARSIDESARAATMVVESLCRAGFAASMKACNVTNMVASCNFGFRIDLTLMIAGGIPEGFEYKERQEKFPNIALQMKHYGHRITALVYDSGKVVVTGAKDEEQLSWGFIGAHMIAKKYTIDLQPRRNLKYYRRLV